MKNQREIYEALLAGETLIQDFHGIHIKLKDGYLYNVRQEVRDDWSFNSPIDWEIYKEPAKWYENIPEGGVLCWYKNGISVIYNSTAITLYATEGCALSNATPLTKQEIQGFMDNAPENNNE